MEETQKKRKKQEERRSSGVNLKLNLKVNRYNLGIVAGIVVILVVCLAGLQRVKPGYVGLVQNLSSGQIIIKSGIGYTWVTPIANKFVEYPVYTQQLILTKAGNDGNSTYDDSIPLPTIEGQNVPSDIAVAWRVSDPQKLYVKYGGQDVDFVQQTVIRNALNTQAGNVTGKLPILTFNDQKEIISNDITKKLKDVLASSGIEIERVDLRALHFPDAIQKSFQAKIDMENQKQQAQIEQDKANITNQTLKNNADAQAYANRTIAQSLTPELIQKMAIEKLNPNASVIYTPTNGNFLIQPQK